MAMKPVLFLKNISLEGPETMELFLQKRNIPYEIRDIYAEVPVPRDPREFSAVVPLGGPMNVEEEERYPFLRDEKRFLAKCVEEDIPILGICLGSQLLATVLGARVWKNAWSEIGRMTVELTPAGRRSPLFAGIEPFIPVFQWHGDTFDIPANASHLAWSPRCRNQAFSYKNRFFGLQFHIEVTSSTARKWVEAYAPALESGEKSAAFQILAETERPWPEAMSRTADRLYENFFVETAGGRER